MPRVLRTILATAALVTATASPSLGCAADDVVSQEVTDGLTVKNIVFEFSHTVGKSDCPQSLGTMTIVNKTGGPVSFSQIVNSPSVSFDPAGGEIPAGSTKVKVSFTCSPAASFMADIELEFRDEMGTVLGTATITVDGKVG